MSLMCKQLCRWRLLIGETSQQSFSFVLVNPILRVFSCKLTPYIIFSCIQPPRMRWGITMSISRDEYFSRRSLATTPDLSFNHAVVYCSGQQLHGRQLTPVVLDCPMITIEAVADCVDAGKYASVIVVIYQLCRRPAKLFSQDVVSVRVR